MHSLQLGGPFFQLILEVWLAGLPPAPLSCILLAGDDGDGITALCRSIWTRRCAVCGTMDTAERSENRPGDAEASAAQAGRCSG